MLDPACVSEHSNLKGRKQRRGGRRFNVEDSMILLVCSGDGSSLSAPAPHIPLALPLTLTPMYRHSDTRIAHSPSLGGSGLVLQIGKTPRPDRT